MEKTEGNNQAKKKSDESHHHKKWDGKMKREKRAKKNRIKINT
jgi:hypothetical protein